MARKLTDGILKIMEKNKMKVKLIDGTGKYFWETLPMHFTWPYWSLCWTRDVVDNSIIITYWFQP